ncbi:MAG: 4a-hydroxytetrahydrobiopterin dehydratase [Planctomycetota bacterium]
MTAPRRLDESEIAAALAALPHWTRRGDHIERTFRFPDFTRAFGFMSSAALVAERLNHHPDWHNVYATVTVRLSTHDAGGLTPLDLSLASALDALA